MYLSYTFLAEGNVTFGPVGDTAEVRVIVMAVPDCPALHSSLDEDALIKRYFDNGYTYKDIRAFMHLSLSSPRYPGSRYGWGFVGDCHLNLSPG